jgi:hypothetical protein
MMRNCTLHMPQSLHERLMAHLFPGDFDEHGAVVAAGFAKTSSGYRLLARNLFVAKDGEDYAESKRGYRALNARFISRCITYCRDHRLVYLAVHNHGGFDSVGFSQVDYASHQRGYRALLDIARGMPVGALVFAERAAEADIWFPDGSRSALQHAVVLGARLQHLWPSPPRLGEIEHEELYHRQVLFFGKIGQARFAKAKIGIIGLGGIGSLLTEYLARLGVGHLVLVDPDHITESNFSRVVGATVEDVISKSLKVDIAERVAKQANPAVQAETISSDLVREEVASRLIDCDYLFLAADSMRARLVFNALVQQYYIPGVQLGAKVSFEENSGELQAAYSVVRRVRPGHGCLLCNQLINSAKLADEWKTDAERQDQHYGTQIPNPSVITLNAVSAAHAVNGFLFDYLGLGVNNCGEELYTRYDHLRNRQERIEPRCDTTCTECSPSDGSRLGMGDALALPSVSTMDSNAQLGTG